MLQIALRHCVMICGAFLIGCQWGVGSCNQQRMTYWHVWEDSLFSPVTLCHGGSYSGTSSNIQSLQPSEWELCRGKTDGDEVFGTVLCQFWCTLLLFLNVNCPPGTDASGHSSWNNTTVTKLCRANLCPAPSCETVRVTVHVPYLAAWLHIFTTDWL